MISKNRNVHDLKSIIKDTNNTITILESKINELKLNTLDKDEVKKTLVRLSLINEEIENIISLVRIYIKKIIIRTDKEQMLLNEIYLNLNTLDLLMYEIESIKQSLKTNNLESNQNDIYLNELISLNID